ncbi:MAG TPA: TetR/AcrR family transcriptional regulator [Anaerolineales bacterium]
MDTPSVTRGERTRAEITLAAHQLFLERGYHGTSMRQIAQAAGVALGGIYNHFPSKEEIFLAVLIDHHPYVDVIPAILSAQGETVEELVRDAAEKMVAEMGGRRDILNLMFIELVEFNGAHLTQLFQLIFPQMMAFAQRFLQGHDNLRPIPLPILLRAFIGLFFSYIMMELILGKYMPVEMKTNSLDYFVDIFLNGILEQ